MKKLLFFLALIFIFTASLSFAAPIGKITQVQGRVDVLKTGKNMAAPVSLGAPVDIGDIYRAKTNSKAEITFINNNILRIAPATKIEIKEYMAEGNRSSAVMRLHRGRVQAISGEEFVKRVAAFAEGNKFEVHTPNAVAGIRGSDMLVGFTQGTTVVIFIAGHGYLYNPGMPQLITPIATGQMSFVAGEGTPTVPVKASEAFISGGGEAFILIETKKELPEETPPPPPPPVYVPPIIEALPGENFEGGMFAELSGGSEGQMDLTLIGNIPNNQSSGTMSASGSYTMSGEPKIITGVVDGTSDKGGLFYGLTGGVIGSWGATASALYLEGSSVGLLRASLLGTLTPADPLDPSSGTVSGSGILGLQKSLGTITVPAPGPEETPLDAFRNFVDSSTPYPVYISPSGPSWAFGEAVILDTSVNNIIDYKGITTNEGKQITIILEKASGIYTNTGPYSLAGGMLGFKDTSANAYLLGPAIFTDNGANKMSMVVSYDYIDTQYMGYRDMLYYGTYDGSPPDTVPFRWMGTGAQVLTPTYFGGEWYHSTLYNEDGDLAWDGYSNGYFGFLKRADGNYKFLAIGEFYDYGNGMEGYGGPYIWSGAMYHEAETVNRYMEAFTGGIWKKANPSDTYGTMAGYTAAVYYNEDGKVGLVKGNLTGNFYEMYYDDYVSGMWKAESGASGLTNTDKTTSLPAEFDVSTASIDNNSLYAYLAGSFAGSTETGNTIFGEYYNGKTKFITYYDASYMGTKSLPFGIYNLKLGEGSDYNYYYGKPAGTSVSWSAKIGGDGEFGYNSSDEGYWLAGITGTWNEYSTGAEHGTIGGNLSGTYITSTHMGTIGGPFYGLYTDDGEGSGTWIGLSVGTYEGTPLKFFSYFNGIMLNASGSGFTPLSPMVGYFGGTTSLWSGSNIPVTIMGSLGPSCLWYTFSPIQSYNATTDGYTTYDGGAFYGVAGGNEYALGKAPILTDKTLEGKFVALYIDPSQKAGFLKASLSGDIYKDIGMFEMSGLINRTEKTTSVGISASDLSGNISEGVLDGVGAYLNGKFNNGATITGGEDPAYPGATYAIATQPWGIYGLPLLGEFGELTTVPTSWSAKVGSTGTFGAYLKDASPNSDSGFWLASITGTVPTGATTTEGKLFGTLTGKYITETRLGTMDGDVYGTYEFGYWKAVALGTWTGTNLTFVSSFDQYLDYVNDCDGACWGSSSGYVEALVGSTKGPLWSSSPYPFTIIGKYYPDSSLQNYIWGSAGNFYSSNYNLEKYITYDYNGNGLYGAYWGSIRGIVRALTEAEHAVEGMVYALYIDPTGKAGILKGSFGRTGDIGTAYPDIGMFEATGTLTAYEMNSNPASGTPGTFGSSVTDVTPYNLPDSPVWFADGNNTYLLKFQGPEVTSSDYENNSDGGFFDANARVVSMMYERHDQIRTARFAHDKHFGIWGMQSWGLYNPSETVTASKFVLISDQYLPNDLTEHPSTDLERIYDIFSLGTWANGKLSGNAYGVMANWMLGGTAIMVGETLGVYNDDDGGFGAYTSGSWVSTSRFLDSTYTTRLTSLGFPTTLVAQNINIEKNSSYNPWAKMGNIQVFSSGIANMPYVWATHNPDPLGTPYVRGYYYDTTYYTPPDNGLNHMYGVLMKNAGETLYARFEMLRAEAFNPPPTDPFYDPSDTYHTRWIADIWGIGAIQTTSGSWIQGSFWGVASGKYTDASPNYSFGGNAAGFFDPSTVGEILPDATNKYSYLRTYDGSSYQAPGYFKGMMELDDYVFPIWMATTEDKAMDFEAMGYYSGSVIDTSPNSANYLFITNIYPRNFIAGNYTTLDGSSYWGWTTGIYRPYGSYNYGNNLEGWVAGLYIGKDGSTYKPGLFMGRFGEPDPVTGWSSSWVNPERAEWGINGGLMALDLWGFGMTTSVTPANLKTSISSSDLYFCHDQATSRGIVGNEASPNAHLYLPVSTSPRLNATMYWISDVPKAGTWKSEFYGTIDTNIWSSPALYSGWNFELNAYVSMTTKDVGLIVAGDPIDTSPNTFTLPDYYNKMTTSDEGKGIVGYWADIATIARESYTGLMFGKVTGTFNPASLTYQAAALGVWFETKKFLAIAGDLTEGGGRDKLLQLGIPAVEVGSVDLTQYTGNAPINSMAMSQVKFFAPTMGGKPQVWATGNVSGNWTGVPSSPSTNWVGLRDSTSKILLDTYVKSWSGSKWLATADGSALSGNPVYSSGFAMKGAAAGTYTGTSSGTFTGTAAGHAK